MANQAAIDTQLAQLETCRRTLWQLLRQQLALSSAQTLPAALKAADDLRAQIRSLKQTLRAWEVVVKDQLGDEPLPHANPSELMASAQRVFISYKRHSYPDEPLALLIYNALAAAGHQPFIDQTIQVGTDWAQTLERAIIESDYFVVLLSETSVHSEMIAAEVAMSARAARANGRARLLPVHVNYIAALPYRLSRDLDHIQYAAWRSETDTPVILQQLLAAISSQATLPETYTSTTPPPGDAPRPYADPRFLESLTAPGGGLRLQSAVYIERDADTKLRRELGKMQGATITIRAPRQTGKTSLLIRGIALSQLMGSKSVLLDMQMVEPRFLADLDAFLRHIATLVASRLRLDLALIERAWAGPLGAPDKLSYFFEDHVLTLNIPVVLAIDEADRLLNVPFRDSFFGLLRAWHNKRALDDQWDNLNILLVIATEPSLLVADPNQSPFNVGTKLVLDDLNALQVADLNHHYHEPLAEIELPALIALLGGHPYLTSKALYTLVNDGIPWKELVHLAPLSGGPFGDHLRSYRILLERHPELRAPLSQVAARGACSDEGLFYRLVRAGLVRGESSQRCQLRCELYGIYLKDTLV